MNSNINKNSSNKNEQEVVNIPLKNSVSIETEKLKKEILPKLQIEYSIGLQKSIVQYELNNFKESLSLLESTLNQFIREIYYSKEFPNVQGIKSISDMIRELKNKDIEFERDITTQLFRIESIKKETENVDSILMESCYNSCLYIFEWYIKKTQEKFTEKSPEISKYILEELQEIYTEDLSVDQLTENLNRVRSYLNTDNKILFELYLYYLSELEETSLLEKVKKIVQKRKYSIRICTTILVLLAFHNYLDEGLNYLELFKKEYPGEIELKYAQGFIFLKKYIQKGRKKDLSIATSFLIGGPYRKDPLYIFIYTSFVLVTEENIEIKKIEVGKNLGIYLKKITNFEKELLEHKEKLIKKNILKDRLNELLKNEFDKEENQSILVYNKFTNRPLKILNFILSFLDRTKKINIFLSVILLLLAIIVSNHDFKMKLKSLITQTSGPNFPPSSGWSPYQGYMNWDEAKEKCVSNGDRLPSIGELKSAFKDGITNNPSLKDGFYWSSSSLDRDSYYGLDIPTGKIRYSIRNYYGNVLCYNNETIKYHND